MVSPDHFWPHTKFLVTEPGTFWPAVECFNHSVEDGLTHLWESYILTSSPRIRILPACDPLFGWTKGEHILQQGDLMDSKSAGFNSWILVYNSYKLHNCWEKVWTMEKSFQLFTALLSRIDHHANCTSFGHFSKNSLSMEASPALVAKGTTSGFIFSNRYCSWIWMPGFTWSSSEMGEVAGAYSGEITRHAWNLWHINLLSQPPVVNA